MKKFVRQAYYLSVLGFSKLVLLLPYRIAVSVGGFLGLAAYYLIAKTRRLVQGNLRLSFPEKSAGEIRKIAKQVFENQGKNLFELFSFPKLKDADILSLADVQNKERMSHALGFGKGVLIASAHCGNWEILGAALSVSGFPINVIARKIYIDGLNSMLVGLRRSKGVNVILRSAKDSARNILRSLRHNQAIGMLIDQDTDVPGVFVDFFSRSAWTPSGLATIALRTGAKVVLALDTRLADGSHRVTIEGPLNITDTGDVEKDVLNNTRDITLMIEKHIRKYPGQWVWMHDRWKTRPV